MVTPFKDNEIDWDSFENLVERQIASGTHALVPCGTTGESPTLSHEEHMRLVERCVNITQKRVPVIAGTGSNSTKEAIYLTEHAKSAGADAALVVTPYYNKPTQDGLYAHYKAINDAVDIPIIIYNIPGRCVIEMNVETMAELAKLKNIVGVKDATNDLSRVRKPLMPSDRIFASFPAKTPPFTGTKKADMAAFPSHPMSRPNYAPHCEKWRADSPPRRMPCPNTYRPFTRLDRRSSATC